MVCLSDIGSQGASLQFLTFSEAYMDSAARLCAVLARSPKKSNFPRGAVLLYLTLHSMELFLKAAILKQSPDEQFGGATGHDLEYLYRRYAKLYPGKKFAFEVPFKGPELDFGSFDSRFAEELKLFIKEQKPNTPTDQVYRYPRDTQGQQWKGGFGFEPTSFLAVLNQVRRTSHA
jgi:hypothetical protein